MLGQDGVRSTPYPNAVTSCQGRKWPVWLSPWSGGRDIQATAPVGELGLVSTPGRVPLGVSEASPTAWVVSTSP